MVSKRNLFLLFLIPWILPALARGQGVTGPGILWQVGQPFIHYTSAGISVAAAKVIAGTSLNSPRQVELYELDGPGVPVWVFPLPAGEAQVFVAAARNADVFVGASRDSTDTTVTLRGWISGSSSPEWTVPLTPATFVQLTVSHDGSTAALVTHNGTANELRFFDATSGSTIGAPIILQFARHLDLSADGRYAAIIDDTTALVIDRDTGAVRDAIETLASTDSVSISEDAQRMAFGFTGFSVYEWDGAEYSPLWSAPWNGIDFTLRTELSAGGGTLFVTLYEPGQLGRVEAWDVDSMTRLWFYDYSGTISSIPLYTAVSSQGDYLVVGLGNLGASPSDDPEVAVFARDHHGPLSAYELPAGLEGTPVDVAQGPSGLRVVGASRSTSGVDAYLFCAAAGAIFLDGFESGDAFAWSAVFP